MRRSEREDAITELFLGHNLPGSKKTLLKERIAKAIGDGKRFQVELSEESLVTIRDINSLYEIGTFRNIPDAVVERLIDQAYSVKVDEDLLRDPYPKSDGWATRQVVFMALEVFRLYLMGVDPYTRKVLKATRSVAKRKLTMDAIRTGVRAAAEFDNEYEDDDDFDFSSLG